MSQKELPELKYFKILFWLAIVGSVLAFINIIWSMIVNDQFQNLDYYGVLVFNLLGLGGGVLLCRRELFGLKLVAFYFGFQIVSLNSTVFHFNFIHGISRGVAFQFSDYIVKFNYYALVFFILAFQLTWEHRHLNDASSTRP